MGQSAGGIQNGSWSAPELDTLKKLHKEGLTATEVAKQLRRSRNSVLSKWHYLDLPKRDNYRGGRREPAFDVEKIAVLNRAFEDGLSLDQMAAACGVSRDQLRKKLNNLGLSAAGRNRDKVPSPKAPKDEPPAAVDANGEHFTMLTISDGKCRWPHGEVGQPGFHLCGGQTHAALPWCLHHNARAHPPKAQEAA
jgi:GcrA cell cycle regulator